MREREAEFRQRAAREADEARVRQEQLARRIEEEKTRKRSQAAAVRVAPATPAVSTAGDAVFDPYAVLNVPPEVCKDLISLAYHQAKKRFDPELVTHLGDEAQAHFRAKAEALDRAYEMLVLNR